jgi:L-ascorbate oxidase
LCGQADNPGVWMLHCHTDWHQFMGQRLVFAENLDGVSDKPANVFPACPSACRYSFAPYTKSYVKDMYGSTGY